MSRAQRLVVLPMAVIAAVLLVSAATGLARPAVPVRGATHQVSIDNFAFMPANLTVAVGDTVTWTNNDDAPHTATAGNGAFDSGNLDNGQTYSFTFTTAGTFSYICEIHPQMTGTITVQAAPAAPAAPTAAPTTAGGVPNTAVETPTAPGGSLTALGIGLLLAAASGLLLLRARRAR
ncbi:MAG TPA: cupredoxin family copper-binding protein [Candidatus Limnocylindria bacterium]|nr:cupredoxin family copper-binding protein [Candidatus Limnocylindria bacterium]